MKQFSLVLCLLLLVGLFSACGNKEGGRSASVEESAAVSESLPEPSSSSVSESEPEPEPALSSEEEGDMELPQEDPLEMKALDPYPNAALIVEVVNEQGWPLWGVSGMLEMGLADEDSEPPAIGLAGTMEAQACSGEDGRLYYIDDVQLPEKGTLILRAYYDGSVTRRVPIDLSGSPKGVTVTWTGELPPLWDVDPATRRITFLIVDKEGKPVANVCGGLEQNDGASVSYRGLRGETENDFSSDESGRLYLELENRWEEKEQSRAYQLVLYASYDDTLRQETIVELPDPPASYTVIWEKPLPPPERPAQVTGIRLFVEDVRGKPVAGVELGGIFYPKESPGPHPEIGMILGPSDEQGYIRWDNTMPGTYDLLYASKGGESQKVALKMPKDKAMVDITLTWDP